MTHSVKTFFKKNNKNIAKLMVAFLIAAYIGIFCYLSIVRYLSFNSHYYDLGIMDQVVYNTSRGRILRMTDPDIAINTSRFSVHFDPLLVAMAPLYILNPTPINLLVAQTVVLALGGLAVYLIAQKVLKSPWASVLFVFLYLNYYPLELANLFDFHAVTFATTSLLFAYYFLAFNPSKRQWVNHFAGFVFLIVTLLAKENASLIVAFLCVYIYFFKSHKRAHLILAILSFLLFFLIVFHIIPLYREGGSFALSYFDLKNPLQLIKRLFSNDSYIYFQRLLTPLGFLPLLSPLHILIALPEILINLLSSNGNLRDMQFHYTSMITPFLLIADIYAFKTLTSYVLDEVRLKRIIMILLVAFSVWSNVSGGIFKYPNNRIDKSALAEVYFWRSQLQNQNIRISTTGTIAPFFTEHRRYYYFLFDPAYQNMGKSSDIILKQISNYAKADYLLIRKQDVDTSDPLVNAYYNDLQNNSDFILISNKASIEVYKNINPKPLPTPVKR